MDQAVLVRTGTWAKALLGATPSWLRVVSLVALLVQFPLFVYFTYQTRVLRPFADQFDLIDFYLRNENGGHTLRYLFEPHTHHRLPFYRFLIELDVSLFGGTSLIFVAVAALCMAVVLFLLAREVWRAAPEALTLPATALAVMLLLGASNAANVSVPANTPAVHTTLFAILALLLAGTGPDRGPRAATLRRVAALVCICAAAFSNAVGLVLFPVFAFKAWRGGKADRAWLAAVLAFGAVFGAAYLYGQTAEGVGAGYSHTSLFKSVDYFFTYLGLPWVRAFGVEGRMIGVLLFGCAILSIIKKGGREAARSERIAIAFVVLSLGTALLAAIARKDVSEAVDVPVRYRIYLTPLHIGLLMLALPWLNRQWHERRRWVEAGFVVCFALLIIQNVLIGQVAARAAQQTRDTITQFHQGGRTADMSWIIYPDLHYAEAVCRKLQSRGLYYH